MSDNSAPNPTNKNDTPRSGAWHQPQIKGSWYKPEDVAQKETSGWRVVRALPEDMEVEPESKGTWHLPKPEETTFASTDEIQVVEQGTKESAVSEPAAPAPEDTTFQKPRSRAGAPPPEETEFPTDETTEQAEGAAQDASAAALSPEDMIRQLHQEAAQAAEEDGEEDAVAGDLPDDIESATSMTELLALASLIAEEPRARVDQTSGGPTLNVLSDEDEETEAETAPADETGLTPEESALLGAVKDELELESQPAEQSTEMQQGESAADYARRMAAQFSGEQEQQDQQIATMGSLLGADKAAEATSGSQAADYARQMAQQFASGTAPATDYTPVPDQTSSMDPQTAELARKFKETEEQVQSLKRMYQAGQISRDDLQQQLRNHMVLDADNVWWTMGVETDKWYKFENNTWTEAVPPIPQQRRGAPPTATSGLDPSEVIGGSLPYLEESRPQSSRYGGIEEFTEDDVEYSTPLPQRADQQDLYATTVNPAVAFDSTLPSAADTLQSARPYDPSTAETVQQRPVNVSPAGGLVEQRTYESIPAVQPDYDMDREASIYEKQAQTERSSALRVAILGFVALLACGLITGIAGVLGVIFWYQNEIDPWLGDIAALANYEAAYNTVRIMDAENGLIAELTSREAGAGARTEVELSQISPYALHAIITQENPRFYDDPGFDPFAIARAFAQNLSSGDIESGASTITQQIARNLVIRDTNVTASRKITEILVANEIARQYTKDEILKLYVNEVFFGNQSYGIEEAARFYFGKHAADLNLAESALLASIVPAPSTNEPVFNRDTAIFNMKETLRKMTQVNCIDFQHDTEGPFCLLNRQVDLDGQMQPLVTVNPSGSFGGVLSLQIADVELTQFKPREVQVRYPHFVNYVQGQVEQMFGAEEMFQRGFTIHTTLIPRIQNTAETQLSNQVARLVSSGVNTGAVMVTDPNTGAIRAMVGSPDFSNEAIAGQVDNTRTWQQPGSAIKPVVYTAGLLAPENYLTPVTILWDVPSVYTQFNPPYQPQNFRRGQYLGPVTVRTALQRSLNVPAVKAYSLYVGNDLFVQTAEAMGLRFLNDPPQVSLASALGATDVRLIDMVKAYGTLATGGEYVPLVAITRITENINGQEVEVAMPAPLEERHQAISPQVAFMMQNILSDDAARAPEFGANTVLTLAGRGIQTLNRVATKTGTSDEGRDLWTLGFTKNYVVGVWVGTFDNSRTFNQTGFTAAAPIWNAVMSAATVNNPPEFTNPGGVVQVEVCLDTGTLYVQGEECLNRSIDFAMQNKLPPQSTNSFIQTVQIDTWTGLRANEWCPDNQEVARFANITDPFAIDWLNNNPNGQTYARNVGIPIPLTTPPTEACQQGMTLPSVRINNPSANQTITGPLTITGQVSAPNFNRYQLLYASAQAPDNFLPIIEASTTQHQQAGSVLGVWDTTTVLNGAYIIRLEAISNNGGYIVVDVPVTVNNVAPTATPTVPSVVPTSPGVDSFTPIPFDPVDPTPTATLEF